MIDAPNVDEMAANAGRLHYRWFCLAGCSFDIYDDFDSMRRYGKPQSVRVPNRLEHFTPMPRQFDHLPLSSSPIGFSPPMRARLDFAAANDIKSIIERFTHPSGDEAIRKLRLRSIRFSAKPKNDSAFRLRGRCDLQRRSIRKRPTQRLTIRRPSG